MGNNATVEFSHVIGVFPKFSKRIGVLKRNGYAFIILCATIIACLIIGYWDSINIL